MQKHSTPISADLEETAELPVLTDSAAVDVDKLAGTDTWIAPNALAERDAEIGALRSDLVSVTESRGALEQNLRSLTGNLRELEQLLNSKSEQLSVFEREVGARDRRIADLDKDLGAVREELAAAAKARADLERELTGLRQHLTVTVQEGAQRDAAHQVQAAQHAARQQRVAQAEAELSDLRARTQLYRESLQDQEGRRSLFDGQLREREQTIDERDAKIGGLESDLAQRTQHMGMRERELVASLAAEALQVKELSASLATARAEIETLKRDAVTARNQAESRQTSSDAKQRETERAAQEQTRAAEAREQQFKAQLDEGRQQTNSLQATIEGLRAERAEALARASSGEARVSTLEREAIEHTELMRALRDQLSELTQQGEVTQADLRAAEDSIRALEGDVRQRDATIARLERSGQELRTQVEAAQHAADERAALISRLETETASSAAVLGSIQQNLQQLGREERVRLLVRTEGETGIVHVLGRKTTIGRTPDNDLRIDADFVSRHHAVVLVSGTNTTLEDLNSTNGVFVNGQKVTRRNLVEGDLIGIGKVEFRLVLKPASDRPA